MEPYSTMVGKLAPRLAAKLLGHGGGTEGVQVFATADLPALVAVGAGGSSPNGRPDGPPVARTLSRIKSPDGYFVSGMWDCTAGTLEITFDFDELVHILDGEVTVRTENADHVLVPGSVAFFRNGLVTTWRIPRYVRKMYVHRYPHHNIASRAVRKLIRLVH
jgi:uncharacterized cupin superfamily protein